MHKITFPERYGTFSILPLFLWQMLRWRHCFSSSSADFTDRNHDAVSTESNEVKLIFTVFRNVRRKLHFDSFFPKNTTLLNRLQRECFPTYFNLDLFKSTLNRHLSSFVHILPPLLPFISHTLYIITISTITLYIEWLSWFLLGEIY